MKSTDTIIQLLNKILKELKKINKKVSVEEKEPEFDLDEMVKKAKIIAIENQKISSSMLQRMLKIRYAHTAEILYELEEEGIIGPPNGAKPREVLIKPKG